MKKYLLITIAIIIFNNIFAQNINVIEPELQEILNQKSDELISVNIIFKSQMNSFDLPRNISKDERKDFIIGELKHFSEKEQSDVMAILKSEERNDKVAKIRNHWLVNAINCELSLDVINQLSSHPDIAIIGYDRKDFLLWEETSQPYDGRGLSQSIAHINADDVWDLGYTGKDVLVALLDTGVDIEHIDLVNNLWDGGEEFPNHGYNTYEDNHNVNDGFGHGTHCAGIICGNGTTGTQTGIAPDATIMVIKVMDDGGYGGASGICSGMEFALEHGADLMNMSLGIPNASTSAREMLRESCVNTMNIGIAATVAAGNEGQLQISFPAPNNVRTPGSCPPPWIHPDQQVNVGGTSCCIVVGAVDFNNADAPFSSRGPVTWQATSYADYPYEPEIGLIRPDVCAPGVGIISADPFNSNGLTTMDGTSQAAPCVAGIVCLMLEKNPELTPEQISMILETTAVKLDENKNNVRGSGLVDALAAIENIENGDDTEDCDAPTNLIANTIDEYSIALSWNEITTATSYDIYRNNTFVKNVTSTSYNDEGLNPATEYCYTVVSVCENGESEHSSQTCATTDELIIPCDAPNNLDATVEEYFAEYEHKFEVTLTWDEVDNAEAYVVYMNGEKVEEVTTPSYIYGCNEEMTIEFSVITKCDTGESEMSDTITVEVKHNSITELEDRFEIFPNPVKNTLIIRSNDKISDVVIYNVVGITILNVNDNFDNISVADLLDGIYFVRINTDHGNVVKRFVKE